jgi:fido (protein-threonine AMPylation protein)
VWTHELEQTPSIRREIIRGIVTLARWIDRFASADILDLNHFLRFHRTMFGGAFPDAAGRLRGPAPGHIPTNVEFGNYRGERYEDVPDLCEALFNQVVAWIHELDDLRQTHSQAVIDEQARRLAAYVHCELVRIHPFVDGNGRTARACVNYVARRYSGHMPLSFDRPGGDYRDAVRTYLQLRRSDHFADFLALMWRAPDLT